MTAKSVYHYDLITKEFMGASKADVNPLRKGEFLIPAHATTIKPPAAKAHKTACFKSGKWQQVDDYRGQDYWLQNGEKITIAEIGIKPPADALEAPPPPPFEDVKRDALATIKARHAATLNQLTGNATVEERDSWTVKALAAAAHQNNTADANQTALLQAEVEATGETVAELATKIIAHSTTYHALVGQASGLKRKAEKQIEECKTATDIETALAALEQEMQSAITSWQAGA